MCLHLSVKTLFLKLPMLKRWIFVSAAKSHLCPSPLLASLSPLDLLSVNHVRKAFCSLFLSLGSFESITIQLVTNDKSSMPSQPYPRKSRGRHSDPTILSLLDFHVFRICIRNYHDLDHDYQTRFTSTQSRPRGTTTNLIQVNSQWK